MAVPVETALPLLVYTLPVIRQLEGLAYYLIAANRSKHPSVEPRCKQYPEESR
jgi:hypothetical protein